MVRMNIVLMICDRYGSIFHFFELGTHPRISFCSSANRAATVKGVITHLHHMEAEYCPIGFRRVVLESMSASYGVVSTKDVNDARI